MKSLTNLWRGNAKLLIFTLVVCVGLAYLLLHKLGSLVGGLSSGELATATTPIGLHGIINNALDLPIKIVRSAVFLGAPDHGQTLTRLPNAFFGGLAVVSFGVLIWLWHGARTGILATLMFATSAWTLHVSRLASNDVLYLWAIPTLLLIQLLLHRYGKQAFVWYGCLMLWGLLLYVPGMIWLIITQVICQRKLIYKTLQNYSTWPQRTLSFLAIFIWLPLLLFSIFRHGLLSTWIGLPNGFVGPWHFIKQFLAVPVHLFFRGPEYPDLWLDRIPIMDIFTLIACILGIIFYIKNRHATRSQTLLALTAVSFLLVGLGGKVSISTLVALMYVFVAAGLAYLLQDWLKVFPLNPLARGLGITLVVIAVGLSCVYNLRSYFVAWPHSETTRITFRYHR